MIRQIRQRGSRHQRACHSQIQYKTSLDKPSLAALLSSSLLCAVFAQSAAAQQIDNTPANNGPVLLEDDVDNQTGSQIVDDSQIAREDYPAAYFTQYAPRSANDMIEQVPGFQVEDRDSSRGLGQGGANILINSARLTGKNSASDQLSRIAAINVERIEIIDGASLNIPGLSGRVANIIVSSSGGLSGVWEWEPEFRSKSEPNPARAELSISGEKGTLEYTFNLEADNRRNIEDGPELLTNADGVLLEERFERVLEDNDVQIIGADLTWKPRPSHIATLSTQYSMFNINDSTDSDRARADTAPADDMRALTSQETFSRAEDEVNFRLSADYSLPLGIGTLKVIGDYRDELSPSVTRLLNSENDIETSRRIFTRDQDEGERILRGEYKWKTAAGSDLQFSTEGAFNFLDIFETRDTIVDDVLTTSIIDSRVEETRGEATLTYGRALSKRLNLQSSLGIEYSEIEQTDINLVGDEFSRDFIRAKGFVNLAYAIDDNFTLRGGIERQVGQLNFGDLIDSADLQNDLGDATNPDLVPEQSWIANVELDKDFGQGNRLSLNIFGESIEDVVDRIPIGLTQEAVGNLDGTATRFGLELSGALRGERWGYDGVQTEITFNYFDTSLDDPLTGESRPISNSENSFWSWAYRHDIPNTDWAYGGGANDRRNYPTFRLGTLIDSESTLPRTFIYIEHKDVAGVKVQARLLNLVGLADFREQINFSGRRSLSEIEEIERREIEGGLFFRLQMSGTF